MKIGLTTNNSVMALCAMATSSCQATTSTGTSRIAGYQTKSKVTGSKIDLDQAELEQQLASGSFDKAKQIYKLGAHMSPYATISLEQPLRQDVESGAQVLGMSQAFKQAIYGSVGGAEKGTTTLYVNYAEDDENEASCSVGGNVEPSTEGCLAPRGGLILDGYGAVDYSYTPISGNQYWGSLYGFSEHEAERMFHCKDKCPYPEYEKFYHYYGQMDYGTEWIEAAFDGQSTDYGPSQQLEHGNEDFSLLSQAGRAQAIQTATVTMNVFTQVNRLMTEWSVEKCLQECTKGNICPEATEPWDMAIATYAGSMEGPEGTGQGYLLYSLADQLCTEFATCGDKNEDIEGTSGVNLKIIQQFQSGRYNLEVGNCKLAEIIKRRIVQFMTVPLIQGTLRSAYRLQTTQYRYSQEEKGRAAAFVASILPDVYACSHMDASILYENMKLSSTMPNFADVKKALERNYECMRITCEEVGGLYDADSARYFPGAEACGQRRTSKKANRNSKNNNNASSMLFGFGLRGFLLCNLVVFGGILVVTRQRWIPAALSQVDSLWSSATGGGAGRRFHYAEDPASPSERSYEVPQFQLQGQPGYELSDSANYHQIPDSAQVSSASFKSLTRHTGDQ